jgi:hypothetical protein
MLLPIELHKALQKKADLEAQMLSIPTLAKELQVEIDALKDTIMVLENMQMVKVDKDMEILYLTPTGRFANLDIVGS